MKFCLEDLVTLEIIKKEFNILKVFFIRSIKNQITFLRFEDCLKRTLSNKEFKIERFNIIKHEFDTSFYGFGRGCKYNVDIQLESGADFIIDIEVK